MVLLNYHQYEILAYCLIPTLSVKLCHGFNDAFMQRWHNVPVYSCAIKLVKIFIIFYVTINLLNYFTKIQPQLVSCSTCTTFPFHQQYCRISLIVIIFISLNKNSYHNRKKKPFFSNFSRKSVIFVSVLRVNNFFKLFSESI